MQLRKSDHLFDIEEDKLLEALERELFSSVSSEIDCLDDDILERPLTEEELALLLPGYEDRVMIAFQRRLDEKVVS